MKPIYRPLLIEAWHFSRTRFFLWPLAFFTSLVGIAGTFQILFDTALTGDDASSVVTGFFAESDFLTATFVGWSQAFDQIPWTELSPSDAPLVLLFFILLALVLTLTVITLSSEGALIYALDKLHANKKPGFLESFRHGLDAFWSLLMVNLLYRLIYLIVLGVIILPLLFLVIQTSGARNLWLSTILYLVLVPTVIIFDLVTRYSIMYIILRKATIRQAFSNAWLLFRTNWIISIETSILILATLLVAFIALSIIVIPLLVVFFSLFTSLMSFSEPALQLATVITLSSLILVVALFVTIFTTLQMSLWVGIFRTITSGQHYSKTHRL